MRFGSLFVRMLIGLVALALVLVFLVLLMPHWFIFQPSFGQNVSTLAMMLTALATLILAYAAFRTIDNSNEQEKQRRKDSLDREQRDRKERLLNEIIEWVSDLKPKTLQADSSTIMLGRKQRFEGIFLAISDALLKAELMNLRASENFIPIEEELNNVWQSAFFCAQLAARIAGWRPTEEQRNNWSNNARDIVARIDQLEAQGKLTDQEMRDGQKDLLEKVKICLKKLVKVEATLK